MSRLTDDVRIKTLKELIQPESLIDNIPLTQTAANTVITGREAASKIFNGSDDRLLVVVGPCSIHDTQAAIEYAKRLKPVALAHQDHLHIIMRVYFEKPRTRIGWKGLINDPHLDNSFDINTGLRTARQLLADIAALGLPAGVEFLDTITPQYVSDLVSWGAIGARTTESQIHRELASGLSMPIGFKNSTYGDIDVAIDGVKAAMHPHHFLSVTKEGHTAIVSTIGNNDGHIILRGGRGSTNYDETSVVKAAKLLDSAGLSAKLMVDCSHGNSEKDYTRQSLVVNSLCQQIQSGSHLIAGVMLESHLNPGKQNLLPGQDLAYGVSITDACIGWEETESVLQQLAEAVVARRELQHDDDALSQVRRKIDAIDQTIEELISARAEQAIEVARIKTDDHNKKGHFYRPEREAQVLREVIARNKGPLSDEAMEKIFREIMTGCLSLQSKPS